ncbi:7953_t:CDS:2, partial [Gigaspora rosea]
ELIFLEKGETQDNKKKKLVIKFTTLIGLFRIFSDTYDNYYLPSSVAERSVIQYIEENLEIEHPLRKKIEIFLEYFDSSKYQNEQFWQYMNYENPKGKEFINKLVQEHIDLQDQSEKQFANIYTQERLKKQFKEINIRAKEEIKRTAQKYKRKLKKN